MDLIEHTPGAIWLVEYPVHYSGVDFRGRMTVIRLPDGRMVLHSPCAIDADLAERLRGLGEPAFLVAPGSFHYLHVAAAQAVFPEAQTLICPGVERKQPQLGFTEFLSDTPPEAWTGVMDQVLVRGTRFMWEVVFFHRPSRTLIVTDLIENIGDATPGTDWKLKLWWKGVFHMWNKPRPAPEYQLGWSDKTAAKASIEQILAWDFERIILSHGDLIDSDAKAAARDAWARPLSWEG